jgi:hypothetical protein
MVKLLPSAREENEVVREKRYSDECVSVQIFESHAVRIPPAVPREALATQSDRRAGRKDFLLVGSSEASCDAPGF